MNLVQYIWDANELQNFALCEFKFRLQSHFEARSCSVTIECKLDKFVNNDVLNKIVPNMFSIFCMSHPSRPLNCSQTRHSTINVGLFEARNSLRNINFNLSTSDHIVCSIRKIIACSMRPGLAVLVTQRRGTQKGQ